MGQRTLGLDIGFSSIKAVVIESNVRNFQVVGFMEEVLIATEDNGVELYENAVQNAISNILEALKPIDQVFTNFPGSKSSSLLLDLPFSDKAKIDQVIGFQLDESTPFDIEELIYDYQFCSESKEASQLLVGTARREDVESYLDFLNRSGVDPKGLLLEGESYYHLFHQVIEPKEEECFAVLDIGAKHSTFVVFQKTMEKQSPTRVLRVRHLKVGLHSIEEQIKKKGVHNPSPEYFEHFALTLNPIVMEIRRTIGHVKNQCFLQLEHVYVTGGVSFVAGFHELLASKLQIAVSQLHTDSVSVAEELNWIEKQHPFQYALSLALRGLQSNKFCQINFRKDEFTFKGDLQFLNQRLGSIFVGAAILLFLFLVSVYSQYFVLASENQKLKKQASETCLSILGKEEKDPSSCLLSMQLEIAKVSGKKGGGIIPQMSSYDIFKEIYHRLGNVSKFQKIKIQITKIRITGKRFDLDGETESFLAVEQIEKRLQDFHCFKKLTKGSIKQLQNKKIEFQMSSDLSC